ncbi:MAG: methionine aminotransferase [Sediminibacterium sp.]|nr:methionine aminotransferase [Sediminibacterium sp.]
MSSNNVNINTTSIYTKMSQLAIEYNALNLGQGFPNFNMPPELIELVNKAMQDGHNQYAHTNGYPFLRENIAHKIFNLYQQQINPIDEITITPGATYCLYTAMASILKPMDEVIIFEPCFDSYIPVINMFNAKPIPIEINYPNISIPWEEVESKINPKTKAIIINTPHNPFGFLFSKQDFLNLEKLVENKDIYIISDEVYEHIVFDNHKHISIIEFPNLFKKSVVCFSFGKTFSCTGWKIGYCIAPKYLMDLFRQIHQFLVYSVDTPKQIALAQYILDKNTYLSLSPFLQEKRDFFRKQMNLTKFTCIPAQGSYFACYSFADISNENDEEFAIKLTKQYRVATIPLSPLYSAKKDHKLIRFCFAKNQETLEIACERLRKIVTI